jgi:hypothetical protein
MDREAIIVLTVVTIVLIGQFIFEIWFSLPVSWQPRDEDNVSYLAYLDYLG